MEHAVTQPKLRPAYAVLTVLLLACLVLEALAHGGWWQIAAFGIAPDLALFLGIGAGLERGQLHARAVPLYNALHRFWGPVVLGALAAVGVVPVAFLVGALAWMLHISVDRTVGYGLRTRDGFQRG